MSRKPDDGYRLPGVSREGVPQLLQMKPHEGFTPEVVRPRVPYRMEIGDGPRELAFATPPDWTRDASCLGRAELVDDPDAKTYRAETKPMCDACPVKDLCLSEALSFEVFEDDGRPLPPKHRYGIWGGLKPRDRAVLAKEEPSGSCGRGHVYAEVGAYLASDGQWKCRECNREQKRRQRASGRPELRNTPTACPACGQGMKWGSLKRHYDNKHPDLTFATEEAA